MRLPRLIPLSGKSGCTSSSKRGPEMAMREITLSKAVNEAIAEEMRRDPTVFVIGEDVAEAGTPFKVLSGLVQEFGRERIVDTPISEPGFMGIAVGAAMTGSRPIVDLMFGDFLFLAMDQLCNQAAKTHYMSGGKLKAPLVLRTNLGATRRSAAQHSQSLHVLVAHGWFDVLTPFGVSKWLVDHLPVGRDRVSIKMYQGGHMLYVRKNSRAALKSDVEGLFTSPEK